MKCAVGVAACVLANTEYYLYQYQFRKQAKWGLHTYCVGVFLLQYNGTFLCPVQYNAARGDVVKIR